MENQTPLRLFFHFCLTSQRDLRRGPKHPGQQFRLSIRLPRGQLLQFPGRGLQIFGCIRPIPVMETCVSATGTEDLALGGDNLPCRLIPPKIQKICVHKETIGNEVHGPLDRIPSGRLIRRGAVRSAPHHREPVPRRDQSAARTPQRRYAPSDSSASSPAQGPAKRRTDPDQRESGGLPRRAVPAPAGRPAPPVYAAGARRQPAPPSVSARSLRIFLGPISLHGLPSAAS